MIFTAHSTVKNAEKIWGKNIRGSRYLGNRRREHSPLTLRPTHFFRRHLDEALEYRTVDCMQAYTNLSKLQSGLFDPTKAIQSQLLRPFERDFPKRTAISSVCCISEGLANDPVQSHVELSFLNCILRNHLLWILPEMMPVLRHSTRHIGFLELHPCHVFEQKNLRSIPNNHYARKIIQE